MTFTISQALLKMRFWMALRLRPADWCVPILLAVPAGLLGALATILFRELIDYHQSFVFGARGDLIALVRATPWYVRLIVPGVGGLLAGCFLYPAERISSNEPHGE